MCFKHISFVKWFSCRNFISRSHVDSQTAFSFGCCWRQLLEIDNIVTLKLKILSVNPAHRSLNHRNCFRYVLFGWSLGLEKPVSNGIYNVTFQISVRIVEFNVYWSMYIVCSVLFRMSLTFISCSHRKILHLDKNLRQIFCKITV